MCCCDTHHCQLIRRGSVLQQKVNDVCVTLLSSLMKRCVSILNKRGFERLKLYFGPPVIRKEFCNKRRLKKCSYSASHTAFCEHYFNNLSFGVDFSLVLQEEVHHLHIAIMTGDMQGRICHLNQSTETHITQDFCFQASI